MDMQVKDAVAIVTGANRGLGASIVRSLLSEGMRVLAVCRSEGELRDLTEVHAGRLVIHHWSNATSAEAGPLVDRALKTFGRLDAVVNNAGYPGAGRFSGLVEQEWRSVFEANLFTPMRLCHDAIEVFVEQGSGKIVNIASTSGLRGKPTLAPYSASKAALVRFTEALANEVAHHNVQVNAIAPGAFATAAQEAVTSDPEILRRRLRKIPARRMGDPDEIGAMVLYLVSPLSSFVTASTFVIDGGEVARL